MGGGGDTHRRAHPVRATLPLGKPGRVQGMVVVVDCGSGRVVGGGSSGWLLVGGESIISHGSNLPSPLSFFLCRVFFVSSCFCCSLFCCGGKKQVFSKSGDESFHGWGEVGCHSCARRGKGGLSETFFASLVSHACTPFPTSSRTCHGGKDMAVSRLGNSLPCSSVLDREGKSGGLWTSVWGLKPDSLHWGP